MVDVMAVGGLATETGRAGTIAGISQIDAHSLKDKAITVAIDRCC